MKCCKLKISIGIYLVFIAIRNQTNELSKGVYIVRTSIDGKVIIQNWSKNKFVWISSRRKMLEKSIELLMDNNLKKHWSLQTKNNFQNKENPTCVNKSGFDAM
jgi:hypothetical protein